jgi:hypothetical protein
MLLDVNFADHAHVVFCRGIISIYQQLSLFHGWQNLFLWHGILPINTEIRL